MSRRSRRIWALSAAAFVGLAAWAGHRINQPFVSARAPEATSVHADVARLRAHVRTLCEEFRPRGYAHTTELDRAASYLRTELAKSGAAVSEQPYEVEGRVYRNVVARFGSTDLSKPRVVVGAHYDVADDFPGADDNASGVAGLLELARMLGSVSRDALPAPIELVGYTLEEPPYFRTEKMGSVIHARSLKASGVRVRAMISLEMIGYFSDEKGAQSYPKYTTLVMRALYPTTPNFIAIVGNFGMGSLVREVKGAMRGATDLPVESLNAPSAVQGVDWSDHLGYWAQGYPAIMVTDTSFLRNKRYHTADDTPDTLDYARMSKVVEGVFQAVLLLSKS